MASIINTKNTTNFTTEETLIIETLASRILMDKDSLKNWVDSLSKKMDLSLNCSAIIEQIGRSSGIKSGINLFLSSSNQLAAYAIEWGMYLESNFAPLPSPII